MMFNLASVDRPALYFTVLGEPPLKMLRYQQQFEFFDQKKVNDSIRFLSLADEVRRPRRRAQAHHGRRQSTCERA
jgi:circadian clock protein KaiC